MLVLGLQHWLPVLLTCLERAPSGKVVVLVNRRGELVSCVRPLQFSERRADPNQ